MSKIDPNAPAFPDPQRSAESSVHNQYPHEQAQGISIRALMAKDIMAGMAAAQTERMAIGRGLNAEEATHYAKECLLLTDALIAELNKGEGE